MVKFLYSPSPDLSFVSPPNDVDRARFFNPSSASSSVSASVVSGQFRVDCLIFPQPAPMNFDAVSPLCFQSIHFFFDFLPPPLKLGGFVPFCNLLIIAIFCCSYNDDILYYLCDTITYKTSTSDIWSLHDHFVKVYI